MKNLLITAFSIFAVSTALASNVTYSDYQAPQKLRCDGEKNFGTARAWECQMEGDMVGLQLGLGVGGRVIGGEGVLTCNGLNRSGEVVACYSQKIDMGLVGVGRGIGLSVIQNITVHSAVFDTIYHPKQLLGTTFGLGAYVDLTALFVGAGAQANISVSSRSGLAFDLGFSHGRQLGLHAGAGFQGFVINKHMPKSLPCNGERPMPDGRCPSGSGHNPFEM